jgi:glucose/arabinose dehydrogenase
MNVMNLIKKHKILLIIILILILTIVLTWRYLPVAPFSQLPGRANDIEATDVKVEVVAENLSIPWSLEFLPNGDLLFTERSNQLMVLEQNQSKPKKIATINSAHVGEGGLLGLTISPEFNVNKTIFLYYTYRSNGTIYNKVASHKLIDNNLNQEKTVIEGIPASQNHNGGRIKFGPDGKLYITTGDAEQPNLAQNKASLAGKILRINSDGTIPEDNPFADSPVYSLGHRNPQGLAWHPETNELFITEHGQRAHDEINKIEAGRNYGWPDVTGSINDSPSADAPVAYYNDPVIESESNTWAPSGATFYSGDLLPPQWRNKLLFAGLRSRSLWRLDVADSNLETLFNNQYGRLRDVAEAPDGSLYIATSNRDGRGKPTAADDRILRITTAN